MVVKKRRRKRVEVNLAEYDKIVDTGQRVPISKADGEKLKIAIDAMAAQLMPDNATSEKKGDVFPKGEDSPQAEPAKKKKRRPNHGRTPASALTGADHVQGRHRRRLR
jgi:hypothetical protein